VHSLEKPDHLIGYIVVIFRFFNNFALHAAASCDEFCEQNSLWLRRTASTSVMWWCPGRASYSRTRASWSKTFVKTKVHQAKLSTEPRSEPLQHRCFFFCASGNRKSGAPDGLPWLAGRLSDAAHGGLIVLVIKTSQWLKNTWTHAVQSMLWFVAMYGFGNFQDEIKKPA